MAKESLVLHSPVKYIKEKTLKISTLHFKVYKLLFYLDPHSKYMQACKHGDINAQAWAFRLPMETERKNSNKVT